MGSRRTSDLILELVEMCAKGPPREQRMFSDKENRGRSGRYFERLAYLRNEIDRRVPEPQEGTPDAAR